MYNYNKKKAFEKREQNIIIIEINYINYLNADNGKMYGIISSNI